MDVGNLFQYLHSCLGAILVGMYMYKVSDYVYSQSNYFISYWNFDLPGKLSPRFLCSFYIRRHYFKCWEKDCETESHKLVWSTYSSMLNLRCFLGGLILAHSFTFHFWYSSTQSHLQIVTYPIVSPSFSVSSVTHLSCIFATVNFMLFGCSLKKITKVEKGSIWEVNAYSYWIIMHSLLSSNRLVSPCKFFGPSFCHRVGGLLVLRPLNEKHAVVNSMLVIL